MLTFAFYADPAMTTPLRSALQATQASASPSAQDLVVYFGSRNPARTAVAAGGGAITLTPTGTGAANVRLAKTLAGLDSATPGAAIDRPGGRNRRRCRLADLPARAGYNRRRRPALRQLCDKHH